MEPVGKEASHEFKAFSYQIPIIILTMWHNLHAASDEAMPQLEQYRGTNYKELDSLCYLSARCPDVT